MFALESAGGATVKRTATVNPDEDAGAAAGWSIANNYIFAISGGWGQNGAFGPLLVAVKGTVYAGSNDATLSDMTVADSRNFLTLTPSFTSGTYAYAAAVDNSDSAVTLNPTVNHGGAGVSGVTLNGTAVTDADFTDGIKVPSLVVGNNVIVVTITAEDAATTLTYTVTVARATKPADLLVSNLAQSSNGHGSLNDFDQAQAFTTGSNSAGYTLVRVEFDMEGTDQSGSALTATIHADDSGAPGTSLGTLTNPSSFSSNAIYSFTTTGIALDASTTYFVVLDVLTITGNTFSTGNTSSDTEDANSETSWTIANGSIYRAWDSTGTWTSFADSKKMRVRGTAKTNTAATGKPAISGTAQVGQELTASTSGITDADGKTKADNGDSGYAYTYQWVRVDGGTENNISGQTDSTYTLFTTDQGKKVKVKVSFTDDADNSEGPLSSDAYPSSGTILAQPNPTVSISADKTSAVFKQEGITYSLTRTGATTAALPVSVTLTQTKNFLLATALSKTVTIPAGQTTKTFTVAASSFQHFTVGETVEAGTLTATVQDATNYDLGTPSAVDVAIVIGITVRIELASYTVDEADGTLSFAIIARTGAGAPQPSSATGSINVLAEDRSASNAVDFAFTDGAENFQPSEFLADGGVWQAESTYNVSITNDDLDEDDETFILAIERGLAFLSYSLVDASGNSCGSKCTVTATIVDDDTAGVTVSRNPQSP